MQRAAVPSGNDYRARASSLFDLARSEENRSIRAKLEQLALAYVDLAERTDRKVAYLYPTQMLMQQQQTGRPRRPEQNDPGRR